MSELLQKKVTRLNPRARRAAACRVAEGGGLLVGTTCACRPWEEEGCRERTAAGGQLTWLQPGLGQAGRQVCPEGQIRRAMRNQVPYQMDPFC